MSEDRIGSWKARIYVAPILVAVPVLAASELRNVLPESDLTCFGIIGLIAAPPAAYVLVFRGLLRGWVLWVAAAVPAIVGLVLFAAWLKHPPSPYSGVPLSMFGIGIGAALAMGVLTAAAPGEPGAVHRGWIGTAGVVWLALMAAAVAAGAALPVRHDGYLYRCMSNMKEVATAMEMYREKNGREPASIDDLAKAGLMRDLDRKCPRGGTYRMISVPSGRNADDTIVLVCDNHRPYLLVTRRNTRTQLFRLTH